VGPLHPIPTSADEFALASLKAIVETPGLTARVECVCAPNLSKRRGKQVPQPVLDYTREHNIPVHHFPHAAQAQSSTEKSAKWRGLDDLAAGFDLGIAVSYGTRCHHSCTPPHQPACPHSVRRGYFRARPHGGVASSAVC
jgi:methionyl-tRNA formyltransferase